ncbi:unnamed protein product [Paramecium octaurelia]|uniref:Uncharacterized protein n=1 Tax=Paramecium octaurelia TaxID=43137 RepID=A0A8S1SWE8_PAROT|nr:unnamed protein product [Paramecium octaurelia]
MLYDSIEQKNILLHLSRWNKMPFKIEINYWQRKRSPFINFTQNQVKTHFCPLSNIVNS